MSTELTKPNGNHDIVRTDDTSRSWASAPVDVLEGNDELLVLADVPGVKREDIDIEYADGELRLHARGAKSETGVWATDYRRTFDVGQGIDVDGISAELTHGVLRVHLPKLASARRRSIAVRAA